jgi:hypothetical protein
MHHAMSAQAVGAVRVGRRRSAANALTTGSRRLPQGHWRVRRPSLGMSVSRPRPPIVTVSDREVFVSPQ